MKSPITVLALMLLALASADSARDDSGPVEALEQRYREIMSKHKHGQIIDRELRDCARNASGVTECAMQVLMKYGGEKLDRDILGQLRSLGHLVSDINDECDSKDIACRRQVSKVALPQVMSAAQAVLQAISKDPHTARLKEVKELQDLFIEIEARLADSKGKEEGKYDSMRDKLEETMESLSRKVSSLRLQ